MVEIPKNGPKRAVEVFAAVNAYLQALISGNKAQIKKTSATWDAVADDSEVKDE
jgi:hypothetical protein